MWARSFTFVETWASRQVNGLTFVGQRLVVGIFFRHFVFWLVVNAVCRLVIVGFFERGTVDVGQRIGGEGIRGHSVLLGCGMQEMRAADFRWGNPDQSGSISFNIG